MVFINNLYDVTLAPSNPGQAHSLLSASQSLPGMSFEQASQVNAIYQNNGLICQRQMCQSMTGCEDVNVCAKTNKDWSKVQEFCGPIGTPSVAMNGSWWKLQPADTQQQLLGATQQVTGMNPLPTPYNTAGMY